MNSKKFNMHMLPSIDKRPLVGDYEKTIIILTGKSNIGKSTLTDLLLNDNFNYISIDAVCLYADIPEIVNFLKDAKENGENINYDLGKLFRMVAEKCPKEFIDYFFDRCIVDNENLNILVEGHVLIIGNLCELFLVRCKESGYRVWKTERIL